MKDYTNCPFCQSERDGHSTPWGMSDEGWEAFRIKHYEDHKDETTKV